MLAAVLGERGRGARCGLQAAERVERFTIAIGGMDAGPSDKIICDKCDYASNTRGAFQKHTLRKHGEVKLYMEIDGKFDPDKDPRTHKRKKGKLYECSECDYSNDAKSTFLSHKYTMHGLETPNQNLMYRFHLSK